MNGRANREIQQAKVGRNLGGGPDRAAAGPAHRLLVNDDGRGDVLDLIDGRAGELGQPAAGEGRERLYQLPLRLGIDGIEDQAGLAAAADAGEHHDLVPRYGNRHVLQVVGARSAHDDMSLHETPLSWVRTDAGWQDLTGYSRGAGRSSAVPPGQPGPQPPGGAGLEVGIQRLAVGGRAAVPVNAFSVGALPLGGPVAAGVAAGIRHVLVPEVLPIGVVALDVLEVIEYLVVGGVVPICWFE